MWSHLLKYKSKENLLQAIINRYVLNFLDT